MKNKGLIEYLNISIEDAEKKGQQDNFASFESKQGVIITIKDAKLIRNLLYQSNINDNTLSISIKQLQMRGFEHSDKFMIKWLSGGFVISYDLDYRCFYIEQDDTNDIRVKHIKTLGQLDNLINALEVKDNKPTLSFTVAKTNNKDNG